MISFDVHRVERIRPEVIHFNDFTVLHLHLEGQGIPDNTKIVLYCYTAGPKEIGQQDQPNVPMDLLNQLGLAIENAKQY